MDEVARLAALVEALSAKVERLEQSLDQRGSSSSASPATTPAAEPARRIDRRGMLRLAGAGAAAAAAGAATAVTLGAAEPAAAADFQNLIIGTTGNNCPSATMLYNTSASPLAGTNVLTVSDVNDNGSSNPAAIAGYATGKAVSNGVYGWTNAGGSGVVGTVVGSVGHGVHGAATGGGSATGVFGTSTGLGNAITAYASGAGDGVSATSTDGVGVVAKSLNDTAISADGARYGIDVAGVHADIMFSGFHSSPLTNPFQFTRGAVLMDTAGDLWVCVASGTPGTWRKLGGLSTSGQFHVLPSTIRVYDSRPGYQPAGGLKAPLANGASRVVDATVGSAVPKGATAALVNLTIVNTSSIGFLSLFKNGIAWPGNSSINWFTAGTVLANSAVVALDADATFQARVNVNCSTDLVIDVIGYYL